MHFTQNLFRAFKVFTITFLSFQCIAQQTIGFQLNTEESLNGYTLWSAGKNTYLIDNCGFLVQSWSSEYNPGLSTYLLPNGHLLRTGRFPGSFNSGGVGGIIQEFNWEGDLIWEYTIANDTIQQHHDIEPLPNGNILVLTWENFSAEEAIENGASENQSYWAEAIFEIEKLDNDSAQIVWEWHVWDHLIQDHDDTKLNFGIIEEHPERININYNIPSGTRADWLHVNSIFYDSIRDEIILSARFFSEIYIIDHSTSTSEAASSNGGAKNKGGDILYRWGNPEAYNKGSSSDQQFFLQHDARIIPNNAFNGGDISVFNNGINRPEGNFSSIDIISPSRDSNGNYLLNANGTFDPEMVNNSFTGEDNMPFFSSNMGGAAYLENGNLLICNSSIGSFMEFDNQGALVWEYQNTDGGDGPLPQGIDPLGGPGRGGGVAFRATRYPENFPGIVNNNPMPSMPIETNPINYDCTLFKEVNVIENAKLISVQVQYKAKENSIEVLNSENQHLAIDVYNLQGQKINSITSKKNNINWTLNDLSEGIYFARIYNTENHKFLVYKFYLSS